MVGQSLPHVAHFYTDGWTMCFFQSLLTTIQPCADVSAKTINPENLNNPAVVFGHDEGWLWSFGTEELMAQLQTMNSRSIILEILSI